MVSGSEKKEVGMGAVVHLAGADFPTLQLKAAKKEGRLSEALLDRRAKLKRSVDLHIFVGLLTHLDITSDRFC